MKTESDAREGIANLEKEGSSTEALAKTQNQLESARIQKEEIMRRLAHVETEIQAKRKDASKAK